MELNSQEIVELITEVTSWQNRERKKREFELAQGAEGGLKPYVKSRVVELYPKTGHLYSISDYAVTKKVVNKKAKSYKEAPIRKLNETTEVGQAVYQEIAKSSGLNMVMSEFDKIYNRHGYGLIATFMSQDLISSVPYFQFVPMAPYEFDVKFNDRGELTTVILSYSPQDIKTGALDSLGMDLSIAGSQVNEGEESTIYVVWTDTNHYVVKHRQDKRTKNLKNAQGAIELLSLPDNPANVNPYGVLPFTYCPQNGKVNYPLTNPIGEQAIELNALLSIYLTSGSMQIGQLVLEYPSDQPISAVGQGLLTVLSLPQSSDPEAASTKANYIAPSPNMTGHRESIMTYLAMILDQQGLGVTGKLDGEQEFMSALDRMIANADVQDSIEENQNMYQLVESGLFNIVKSQLSSVNVNPFGDESTVTVIYRKPKMLVTDKEKLENIKLMDEMGMLEPWEKLVIFDPNLSEYEAKAKFELIKKSKEQTKEDDSLEVTPPPFRGSFDADRARSDN